MDLLLYPGQLGEMVVHRELLGRPGRGRPARLGDDELGEATLPWEGPASPGQPAPRLPTVPHELSPRERVDLESLLEEYRDVFAGGPGDLGKTGQVSHEVRTQGRPRIDDNLEFLHGCRYFSTLDLQKGYFQVPLREEDRKKTAFTTSSGELW